MRYLANGLLLLALLLTACAAPSAPPAPTEQPTTEPPAATTTVETTPTTVAESAPTRPPPVPQASAAPSEPVAVPPANPDAVVVELIDRPRLPENVLDQLSFLPPEGGVGGLGSIFNCLGEVTDKPFSTHVAAVGIGGTVTFCYRGVPIGPAVERVFDPAGTLVRELTFDLAPDPRFEGVAANNFTPLPGDAVGAYRVEARTAGGTFEATFEVGPFQGVGDAGIGYARLLKPISRSAAATPTVGETDYLLAVGFAPEETLSLAFYETCRYTGKRRATELGYSYLSGAQARVNRDGYAFFRLPAALRERVPPEQTYTAFTRGDIGKTELPPDVEAWSLFAALIDYGDPTMGYTEPVKQFDGGFNPGDVQLSLRSRELKTCALPGAVAAPPDGAQPIAGQPRFKLPVELTPYDMLELAAADGRLYAHTTGTSGDQAFVWDLATGAPGAGGLPVEQQPRRFVDGSFDGATIGALAFLADGARYIVGNDGALARVDPATGTARELLSPPVSWYTWRTNVDGRIRPNIYPSLTVSDAIAYFGGQDGAIYAVDTLNGETLWRVELPGAVSAPPAVSRQLVYAGSYDGTLYALDVATGAVRWSFVAGGWLNTPVVAGDTVYIAAESDTLFALDAQSGSERWRLAPGGVIFSDPLPVGDLIYIAVGAFEITRPADGAPALTLLDIRADVTIVAIGEPEQLAAFGAPDSSSAPTTAPPVPSAAEGGRRYRTIATSDGFVTVRAEPTTASAEVTRLAAGTEVICERFVVGQAIDGATGWAMCSAIGGYIFGPLLEPASQ